MSLGHMTKQEQAITVGGVVIVMPVFMWFGESYLGDSGIVVGMLVAAVLIFVGKMWAWSHTEYEGSWSNPKWSSGDGDE